MPTPADACVLIPVKAFELAKARLSPTLNDSERAALARAMAEVVIKAALPLGVHVVCDNEEVAHFAQSLGATIEWTTHNELNGAVQDAVANLSGRGMRRVVVCHADLPFAEDLFPLFDAEPTEVLLVSDRRGQGTNLCSIPLPSDFTFAYGPHSLIRHQKQAEQCGLTVRVLQSELLSWDVDEPADLQVPTSFPGKSVLLDQGFLDAAHLTSARGSSE
ncbi:MAG: 2-phospho-L-lactate guanylyltransferase [Microthrixaceae bacterium]